MLFEDFKRIVSAFADTATDFDLARGAMLVQIRDELIEARLSMRGGELVVEESGTTYPAATWVINRIARIPLLAERLLTYVPSVESFVRPAGRLLDQPNEAPEEGEMPAADALSAASELLARRSPGTTSVVYLTSDAGEGKTTLINSLARQQAAAYKNKATDWLLVPIPLGGRTFLRFDDVVIAALVNRLRFPFLYFDAFLELVRLGVIVPAFDGFEEMMIEASAGEAISALGNLVRNLRSEGTVLIAARKAYFDYPSFRSQARLFDAIGQDSVAFARVALERWSRDQFIEYASKRQLKQPEKTYDLVAQRLTPEHPLLTRAVLVRRLVDVAKELPNLTALLGQIGYHPQDYFYQFANTIVEREAAEKWLDKAGDPPQPLLTVEEHHQLLAMIAQEMWLSTTDNIRSDFVGVVGDVFAEQHRKAPAVARQIRERLKQHSLLVAGPLAGSLGFDHEDFRVFYLGEALGGALLRRDLADLKAILQVASLPSASIDEALHFLRRKNRAAKDTLTVLQGLASADLPTSFVRENAGALCVALITEGEVPNVSLTNLSFPPDALEGCRLMGARISDSYFQPTSIAGSRIESCVFANCRFERLELPPEVASSATIEACEVGSVVRLAGEEQIFDPDLINAALQQAGFIVVDTAQVPLDIDAPKQDDELRLLERMLRIFVRSTNVNEAVVRMKLGVKAGPFMDSVLPRLMKVGIIEEVQYLGAGTQRRFKLGVPMSQIQEALSQCKGRFDSFLNRF